MKHYFTIILLCMCISAYGYTPFPQYNMSSTSGGIYLSTEHMNKGAYTEEAGGSGYGTVSFDGGSYNSGNSSAISYSGGSYSTGSVSFPSPSITPVGSFTVYNGDKPGVIIGFENAIIDGAIITAAGGWYQDECPYCHHTVWRQKNHGAQDDMYDKPNGSTKHVCKDHPALLIGDINIFMLLLFVCAYYAFKYFLIKKKAK